ncbi:MAG TPA: hypothetical protein VEX86_15135 [Longimicrobium sp.]|nr:hypothetical protein [Longimicrobium sp.]
MTVPPFTEGIEAIVSGLRGDARSHAALNGAASGIDHLGRHLHGFGFVRDREIADCFTAAFNELSASHAVPEDERGEAVERAVGHLEAALAHAREGVLPDEPVSAET